MLTSIYYPLFPKACKEIQSNQLLNLLLLLIILYYGLFLKKWILSKTKDGEW